MRLHSEVSTDDLLQSPLPFEVSYSSLPGNHSMAWPPPIGTFSTAGLIVHLRRRVLPFIVNIYVPTTILVAASWIR